MKVEQLRDKVYALLLLQQGMVECIDDHLHNGEIAGPRNGEALRSHFADAISGVRGLLDEMQVVVNGE